MKQSLINASGIVLACAYALALRVLLAANASILEKIFEFRLVSITFLWVVPVLMGCIPILCYPKGQKVPLSFSMWSPALSVILFFMVAVVTRIEELICLWMLAIPFIAAAIIGGLIVRMIVNMRRKKFDGFFSVLLIPFASAFAEKHIPITTEVHTYRNSIIIDAAPEKIWPSIIRVSEISDHEYPKGFFYYSGVPRPLYAELDKDTLGAIRTGHFSSGLMFREQVVEWEKNRKIRFDIHIEPSSLSNSVFEQHVLKGKHFRFRDACYELTPLAGGKTELNLTCSYELSSTVNGYAAWWGQMLIGDFQNRLLMVLKPRCEK